MAFAEADGLYQAAHTVLMDATIDTWERGVANASFDNEVLAHKRVATVTAVRLAAQAIDLLHDAAGMSAVAADSVLDRCWRDVHTITQHIVLGTARFETAGRALLGLDPGGPVI
jgi:alkylation response protein AidB-like acyl-CoA dehydrogenase